MKTITFNYNIGNIVTLVKLPKDNSWMQYTNETTFKPKEYKIDGYRYRILEDNSEKIEYRLYAYCDEYLDYHNWISEDFFEGQKNQHEEEIVFASIDGNELDIGDEVYCGIYSGLGQDKFYIDVHFTFARKVKIAELRYVKNSQGFIEKRLFGLQIYPYVDGDKISNTFVGISLKAITPKMVEDYVKNAKHMRFNPSNKRNIFYERTKKWLDYLGIYDNVCKLYSERKKPKSKKENKAITKIESASVLPIYLTKNGKRYYLNIRQISNDDKIAPECWVAGYFDNKAFPMEGTNGKLAYCISAMSENIEDALKDLVEKYENMSRI